MAYAACKEAQLTFITPARGMHCNCTLQYHSCTGQDMPAPALCFVLYGAGALSEHPTFLQDKKISASVMLGDVQTASVGWL